MKTICIAAAALCLTLVSCNGGKNKNDANADADFVKSAADAGMLEVKLGELAQSNAFSEEVKDFGKSMVNDHGKANDALMTLARQKKIEVPSTMSEKNQDTYDKLSEKTGGEFDQAYVELMVQDHKKAIDLFEKEAKQGKDADLSDWAKEALPTLNHHLHMIEEIQAHIQDTTLYP